MRPFSRLSSLAFTSWVAGCVRAEPCPALAPPAPAPPPLVVAAPAQSEGATLTEPGLPYSVVRRKNYRIEFGSYGFEIDPADGARVLEFSLAGKSIIVPITESSDAYGSSIWVSPQSDWQWPPPPELDKLPWHVGVESRALTLQSEPSEKLGIAVRQRITAEPNLGAVRLEYVYENRDAKPRKVAPWQNTRVRPKGLTFFPASRSTYGYKDNNLVLVPEDRISWYAHDPSKVKDNLKGYADGEEGWLAQVDGRLLFVKIFDDVKPAEQAPNEGEVVIYVSGSGKFVEVENQGAYQELQPGGAITWKVLWILRQLPEELVVTRGSRALVDYVRQTVAEVRRNVGVDDLGRLR